VTGIVNHDIEPAVIGNDLGDAGVGGAAAQVARLVDAVLRVARSL
jgi:hypothetical protein